LRWVVAVQYHIHCGPFVNTHFLTQTISPAMDIQYAYNLERMLFYICNENSSVLNPIMQRLEEQYAFKHATNTPIQLDPIIVSRMQQVFDAVSVNDTTTSLIIRKVFGDNGSNLYICPHSAVGVCAAMQMMGVQTFDGLQTSSSTHLQHNTHSKVIISVLTAHPAKFEDSVAHAVSKQTLPDHVFPPSVVSMKKQTREYTWLRSKGIAADVWRKNWADILRAAVVRATRGKNGSNETEHQPRSIVEVPMGSTGGDSKKKKKKSKKARKNKAAGHMKSEGEHPIGSSEFDLSATSLNNSMMTASPNRTPYAAGSTRTPVTIEDFESVEDASVLNKSAGAQLNMKGHFDGENHGGNSKGKASNTTPAKKKQSALSAATADLSPIPADNGRDNMTTPIRPKSSTDKILRPIVSATHPIWLFYSPQRTSKEPSDAEDDVAHWNATAFTPDTNFPTSNVRESGCCKFCNQYFRDFRLVKLVAHIRENCDKVTEDARAAVIEKFGDLSNSTAGATVGASADEETSDGDRATVKTFKLPNGTDAEKSNGRN
jgi:hypothetical protein